jgi:hypothetical protein
MASNLRSVPEVATAGPLVVSKANPRYFTVESGGAAERRTVYLTGAHVNNNFHDGLGFGAECADTPERFDLQEYLQFLKAHGHNFIRMWRWEHFKSLVAGGAVHMCMSPQPWPRTGPGNALDGKPKFDLLKFDDEFFDRLRDYVITAGEEGIYVSVMLFQGFAFHLSNSPDNVEGHPFHSANNINGIGIRSIVDYQVLPLDPHVQAIQEAYIKKIIDTVQDLPNVLYEVANESSGDTADSMQFPGGMTIDIPIGDSTQWQFWVINFVKQYEKEMGYTRHPMGMTMQFPVPDQRKVNEVLFNSPADWISPGFDEPLTEINAGGGPPPGKWLLDPPANDGSKVILSDTDHYSMMGATALWAWKTFLRGHHPLLYDLGIVMGVNPPDPSAGTPSYESLEAARWAMGDTRRYAEKVNLIEMEPRSDLSSTGYMLANPGQEYLILQSSETADPFTVMLKARTYTVEWFEVNTRAAKELGTQTVEGDGDVEFTPPFIGPVVLYLKQTG